MFTMDKLDAANRAAVLSPLMKQAAPAPNTALTVNTPPVPPSNEQMMINQMQNFADTGNLDVKSYYDALNAPTVKDDTRKKFGKEDWAEFLFKMGVGMMQNASQPGATTFGAIGTGAGAGFDAVIQRRKDELGEARDERLRRQDSMNKIMEVIAAQQNRDLQRQRVGYEGERVGLARDQLEQAAKNQDIANQLKRLGLEADIDYKRQRGKYFEKMSDAAMTKASNTMSDAEMMLQAQKLAAREGDPGNFMMYFNQMKQAQGGKVMTAEDYERMYPVSVR